MPPADSTIARLSGESIQFSHRTGDVRRARRGRTANPRPWFPSSPGRGGVVTDRTIVRNRRTGPWRSTRAVALLALAVACAPALARASEPTLQEAARAAGLRVGVLADRRSAAENALLTSEFELLVAHGFSWSVIHPRRDTWNFGPADQVVAMAGDRPVLGMHFVWDQVLLDDAASWVLAITDPDELRAVLREHLRTIHARYGSKLGALTVVNEPLETTGGALHVNHFHRVLGADWVAEVFSIARDEAPGTTLILNENFTEYFPAKADGLVALVAGLVRDGAPIDAVGFQTHLLFGEPDWDRMRRTMKAIGDLGLRVLVTELDAPVAVDQPDRLALQAERTVRVVRTCLLVPACDTVVWWGLHDGLTWLDGFLSPGLSPLLFDATLAPKPSYFAARDAFHAHAPRDLAGRLLRVKDSPVSAARRRIALSSRDPQLAVGDGDPRALGASLRVVNRETGEQAVIDLPPERWSALPPTAGEPGFAFRGTPDDACQGVRLRPGRALEASCRGPGIAFTLDEARQGALVAELRVDGAPLQCFRFGGDVERDEGHDGARGGAFVARRAPATAACVPADVP